MEKCELYNDIKSRTNGDIYVGVVGPVRVGKSTFITEFMKKLVVPNIQEKNAKERTIDELPQSADGKTIMTTQPRFIPNEAVKINVADNVELSVRLIDCVGYIVAGAVGHIENEKPRKVKTPWSDEEMPFEEAAEIGTKKVMQEHSTVGIVVTTDGSVTDIPRSNYVEAEERVVAEMKASNKPFVMVLNCKEPNSSAAKKMAESLAQKYAVPVLPINALEMKEGDIDKIFEKLLFEFPITSVKINMPKWLQALSYDDEIIQEVVREIRNFASGMSKLSDVDKDKLAFVGSESFDPITFSNIQMGDGTVRFNVIPKETLFYQVLSNECGYEIKDDYELITYIKDLAVAKVEYDKIKDALDEVRETGYGVVQPTKEDFELAQPELVKQGNKYGVKIKATAPSWHILRVDVNTEVTPLVGSEGQSQDLIDSLAAQIETDPNSIWETNILGKNLQSLIGDNISSKIIMMPADAQKKMRKTLTKIINEGKGGMICILL